MLQVLAVNLGMGFLLICKGHMSPAISVSDVPCVRGNIIFISLEDFI